MADVKALFNAPESNRHEKEKKDKLAETKRVEREKKEIFKAQRDSAKHQKEEEQHAAAELYRLERSFHPESKRAQKDARHAAKHEAKIAEGQMCEHGVWKCQICFPHKQGK